MRIYWYWPARHVCAHPWPVATAQPGDEIMVHSLAPAPGEIVEDVSAYCLTRDLPPPRAVAPSDGIAWWYSRSRTYWDRARLREAAVRAGRYDVCHIQLINLATDWLAIQRLRKFAPVVLSVHDVVPHVRRLPARVEDELLQRAYHASDALVVFHETLRDELVSRFRVDPASVTVIPHPVRAVEGVEPDGPDKPLVLFFGSFRPNKGINVLLDAIRMLAEHRDLQFVFAGAGEPSLEQMVREAAQGDERIEYEIREVSVQRRDELMRLARLVVLPYTEFHSQSGVLADAYTFGRPVVVTDVGALGATVRADGSGWVARPNDTRDLARVLDEALRDDQARRDAARASYRAGQGRSYAAVGRQLRGLYEAVVGR